jgi:hypothetical protein
MVNEPSESGMIPSVPLKGRLRFELSLFNSSLFIVAERKCKRTKYLGEQKLAKLLAQCCMKNKA